MKRYDHIVVGSGISGMSVALLLAQSGKRVLLLEKAAAMGGSLLRFHRDGVPFDTGFHFTGGLQAGGLLTKMLGCLGLEKEIVPLFPAGDCSQRVVFERTRLIIHPAERDRRPSRPVGPLFSRRTEGD